MICIRCLSSRNCTCAFSSVPLAFDVDVLRTVDHDFADRRLLEQHFQRAEAEGLVEHFLDQAIAFVAIEVRVFGVAEVLDDQPNLAAQHVAFQLADRDRSSLSTSLLWIRRLMFSNSASLSFWDKEAGEVGASSWWTLRESC